MRVLLLTLLLVAPYFYFRDNGESVTATVSTKVKSKNSLDSLQLSQMAPDRILTVNRAVEPAADELSQEAASSAPTEESSSEVSRGPAVESDLEHVEEVQWTDLEEGWNQELKSMLSRLEPLEGDAIHKSYREEMEAYQAELDALMAEKQQKTTDEATLEIEQLISALDQKHQDKLKDVLGAHYEAVRDGYQSYMDSAQSE